jgi:hypothetical protein
MRVPIIFSVIAVSVFTAVHAQEHLVPEPGLLAEYDQYHFKIRELFAAAQKEEIICQVAILASFVPEQIVGIRKTATAHEVFSITPASAIWDTELLQMHEAGRITTFDKDGKKLTLEEDESYQALKKRTPADFRQIKTDLKTVALDDALARRVSAIWERMLLATRQPKEPRQGIDGASYHFSMFVLGRGIISGQIWSPDEKTKTASLVDLAYTLSLFANGKTDLEALKKTITRAEKLTKA